MVNPDLVRWVEQAPDTVITFVDDRTLVVRESPQEYQQKVCQFRQGCLSIGRAIPEQQQDTI